MNALMRLPFVVERPRTRRDCADAPRPCAFAACRHHLAFDISMRGHVRPTFRDEHGDPDLDALKESCSLDVADRGEHSFDEIAEILNVSRQAIDQVFARLAARKQGAFAKCVEASPQDNLLPPRPKRHARAPRQRSCRKCRAVFDLDGNATHCKACRRGSRAVGGPCVTPECAGTAIRGASRCDACTAVVVVECVQMFDGGASYTDIAEHFGFGRQTASRFVSRGRKL